MKLPSKKNSWKLFDRIAHRYDLLNHILSCGQDILWRRRLADFVPDKNRILHLDIATGTADVIIALGRTGRISFSVGIDKSYNMLALGREKVMCTTLKDRVTFITGDASMLPVRENTIDVATMAFGIRNMEDPFCCLGEVLRVLNPGGRLIVLEFSIPSNTIIRFLYLLYFRHLLPFIGGMISGDRQAYTYLNKTVENFPYGEGFIAMLKSVGFNNLKAIPLCFGIATIYVATK